MVFGGDAAERELAIRLLKASRFHPLLMDRLARLATGGPALRPQLFQALEALEQSRDFSELPALFSAGAASAKELAYLEDALRASLDQLIQDAAPDARQLLWMVSIANEPVALGLLKGALSGEGLLQERLRRIERILEMPEMLAQLPPEIQKQLKSMSPELRAAIAALPEVPARPDLEPVLRQLAAVGLVTEERDTPEDDNPNLSCHEVVRERIRAWMEEHPQDRRDLTENAIRLAYAERLDAVFEALQHKNMAAALEAGRRALIYCVQASDYERLLGFTSSLVTSSRDPRLLESLIPHLEAAATSAPEGLHRWRCLLNLADALRLAGRPDASLPFYEQDASQTRAAAESGGEEALQAWEGLAAITGNWALALKNTGNLDAARERQPQSAEAGRRAGSPAINGVGSELEALRIDVLQGRVAEALPQVEKRLERVEGWWKRHRSGETVSEAPDREVLARALIGGLDIASNAHLAQEDWEAVLRRPEATLEVKRALNRPAEGIAGDRLNRANVLCRMGRSEEAKVDLEACLEVFANDPAGRATVLSSLASLFDDQDDAAEALQQECRAWPSFSPTRRSSHWRAGFGSDRWTRPRCRRRWTSCWSRFGRPRWRNHKPIGAVAECRGWPGCSGRGG
jgi:tetratricopeptide (TPR) repeat protein